MRIRVALCVPLALLFGCGSTKTAWHPISGASVMPYEQSRAVCASMLEQGSSSGSGGAAGGSAEARYRSCMAQNGWTDNPVSGRERDERARARHDDAQEINAGLEKSTTKNALTLLVGNPPECQPGDPGTEICSWRWVRHLPTEVVPLQLVCVLPQDGTPRAKDSCRYTVQSKSR